MVAKMRAQLEAFRVHRGGSMAVSPIDPGAMTATLQSLLWYGCYVSTIVLSPTTSLLNAPQDLTRKEVADATAAYIRSDPGGRADVVLLTQDSIRFPTPRFSTICDGLAELPDVRIIADISPNPVGKEGGLATMQTIRLAYPNVDVGLSGDSVVLGALQALREAGKDRPDEVLGGIDGELEAVAEIRKSGPYKVSISLNSPIRARSTRTPHAVTPTAGCISTSATRRGRPMRLSLVIRG